MNIDSGQTLSVSERLKLLKQQEKSQPQQTQPVKTVQYQEKSKNLWEKPIPQQGSNSTVDLTQKHKDETPPPAPVIKKVVSSTETVEQKQTVEQPKTVLPLKTEQIKDTSQPAIDTTNKLASNPFFMQRTAMKIFEKTQQQKPSDLNLQQQSSQKTTVQQQPKQEDQKPKLFTHQFKESIAQAANIDQPKQVVSNVTKQQTDQKTLHQNISSSTQQQQYEEKKQQPLDKMFNSDNTMVKKGQLPLPMMRMPGMGPPPTKKDTTIYTAETEEVEKEQVFIIIQVKNQLQTMLTRSAPKKSRRQKQNLDIEDSQEQNKNKLFSKKEVQILSSEKSDQQELGEQNSESQKLELGEQNSEPQKLE